MAFSLTKSASRCAGRSTAPARKIQNVRCQALPDFKAPIRSALISAATVAAALSMTLGAGASEDLGAAAQRTAAELGAKAQNAATQIKGQANQAGSKISNTVQDAQRNPLSDLNLPGLVNPLAGAGAKVQQVTGKLGDPLQVGSDIVQNTANNIVKDTPFAGSKVPKSIPIEDAANGPDPTGRIKYN